MKKIMLLIVLIIIQMAYSEIIIDEEGGSYEDTFTTLDGLNPDSTHAAVFEQDAIQISRTTSFFSTSQVSYVYELQQYDWKTGDYQSNGCDLQVVGVFDDTHVKVYDLSTPGHPLHLEFDVNALQRVERDLNVFDANNEDPTYGYFKIVSDKPINASSVNRNTNPAGVSFFPATDTQEPIGKEFTVLTPSANNSSLSFFNPNTSPVNIIMYFDTPVSVTIEPGGYRDHLLSSFQRNRTIRVKADLPIAFQNGGGNAFTTVPATDPENLGKGTGKEFRFCVNPYTESYTQHFPRPTQNVTPYSGCAAVYAYEDSEIDLYELAEDGTTTLYKHVSLNKGEYWFEAGLVPFGEPGEVVWSSDYPTPAQKFFYLETDEAGLVEVWAGGMQGQWGASSLPSATELDTHIAKTIHWMGDDISFAGGRELPGGGSEYYMHTMTHMNHLFAPFDGTEVTITNLENSTVENYSLDADEYFAINSLYDAKTVSAPLDSGFWAHIVTTKPVMIQTSGGNYLNNASTNLPGVRLRTDHTDLYTTAVTPTYLKNWDKLYLNDSLAIATLIYYQLEYKDGVNWLPIPDFDLPGNNSNDGNSFGFKGFNGRFTDSVSIALLDTAVYKSLRLHAQMGTSNKLSMESNPRLNGWKLKWTAFGAPEFTSQLVDQTVNWANGERFQSFDLDNFVTDLDDDVETDLDWNISGNFNLNIYINSNHEVTVENNIDPNWYGSEQVIFEVSDPDGNTAADTVSYTVLRQDMEVSRLTVLLGDVKVGETVKDSVYIKNNGTDLLDISNINGLTAPFALVSGQATSFQVSAGDSVFVVFNFTPTATNQYSKILTINGNDPSNSVAEVAISGRGVKAEIDAPEFFSFGSSSLDFTVKDSVEIINSGNYPLLLSDLNLNNGLDGVVFKYSGPAASTIPGNSSIYLPLEFKPNVLGQLKDTLIVTNSDDDENPLLIRLDGVGVDPIFVADASSIDFGSINLEEFGRDTVEIKNIGSDSLIIDSYYGLFPPYEVSSVLGSLRMGPADICHFVIDFDPDLNGNFQDTLKINSNDDDMTPYEIALSGTGIYQQYFTYTSTTDFGTVLKGNAVTDSAVVYNNGSDILSVLSIANQLPEFSPLDSYIFPITLNPLDSLAFRYSFAPADTGNFVDTLTILTDDNNNETNKVVMRGRSVAPYITAPEQLSFGSIRTGQTQAGSFKVKNSGSSDLMLTGFTEPLLPFTLISPAAGVVISAGDSLDINISFSPLSQGAFLDSIGLQNDAGAELFVKLTGIGVKPVISGIDSYDFGELITGTKIDTSIVIKNSGTSDLILSSINSLSTPYSILSATIPPAVTVSANDSMEIRLRFNPLTEGSFNQTLTLSNNSDTPLFSIDLQGSAVTPELSVNSEVDFNSIAVGDLLTKKLLLTNTGNGTLEVSFSELAAPFAMADNSAITILPSASQEISIDFNPPANGEYSQSLILFHNIYGEDPVNVLLKGKGVESEIEVADSLKFSVIPGNNENKSLVIESVGTDLLTINDIEYSLELPFSLIEGMTEFPHTIATSDSSQIGFSPTDGGIYTGTVIIHSSDPNNTEKEVVIYGIGDGPEIECVDSLDFGEVHIYTDVRDTLDLVIGNQGVQTLNIASVSGFNEYFKLVGSVPAQIAAGEEEIVKIEFDPDYNLGDYEFDLTIVSNDFNESSISVNVKANAYQGSGKIEIAVGNEILDFGGVEYSQSNEKDFTIKNSGDGLLTGTVNFPLNFSGSNGEIQLPLTLIPNNEQQYTVKFSPDNEGNYSEHLTILTNDTTADSLFTYPVLIGSGIEPEVTVAPAILNFDVLRMYRTHTKSFRIGNSGDAPLRIKGISGLDGITPFSLKNPADTLFTVAVGEEKELELNFRPLENEAYSDTLLFAYNNFSQQTKEYIIQGSGRYPDPLLSFSEEGGAAIPELNFGNVNIEEGGNLSFVVHNTGDSTLTGEFAPLMGKFELEARGKEEVVITKRDGKEIVSFTIPELDSIVFAVDFKPTILDKVEKDTLLLHSNDDAQPEFIRIPMAGTGVLTAPAITVTPRLLDYGYIYQDSSKVLEFKITNSGTEELLGTITSPQYYTLEGAVAGQLNYNLAPAEKDTFQVLFDPLLAGSYNDTLKISSNDPNYQNINISLMGQAFANGPAMIVTEDTLSFGELALQQSNRLSFQVKNDGDEILNYNILDLPDLPFFPENSGAYQLNPGESDFIYLTFKPSAPGVFLDSMNITSSNSTAVSDVWVYFKGEGVVGEPQITPNFLAYDTIFVNTTKKYQFVIDNKDGIDEFTCLVDTALGFVLADGYNGYFTIPAGQDSIVDLIFAPVLGDTEYLDSIHFTDYTNVKFSKTDPKPEPSSDWERWVQVRGYSKIPRPQITVSHREYDFGEIYVGTDSSFVLQVKNEGDALLTANFVNGDNDNYTIKDMEGNLNPHFELAVDDSASFVIDFIPENEYQYPNTVHIISDSEFEGDLEIILNGKGKKDPVMMVSVETLPFDSVFTGTAQELPFYITNTNGGILSGTLKNYSEYFQLSEETKSDSTFELAYGDTANYLLKFSPVSPLTYLDSISIVSNSITDPEPQIAVTGYGDGAEIAITELIDFWYIHKDTTKTMEFDITNSGSRTMTGKIYFPENYSIILNNKEIKDSLAYSVAPYSLNNYSITFDPDSVSGNYDDTLKVSSNTFLRPEADVLLAAFAFGKGPALAVRPDDIDFGTTYLTYADTLPLTIYNVGDSLLSCQLLNQPGAPFQTLNIGSGVYDIAREDSLNLQVVFTPQATVTSIDSFKITTADVFATVIDSSTIIRGAGFLRMERDSIDYGEIFVMRTAKDSIIINNEYGKEDFLFHIENTDAFLTTGGIDGNYSVAAGENLTLPIIFKPTVVDTLYRDILKITASGHAAWSKDLIVRGYSKPAPLLAVSESEYDFGNVYIETDSSFTLNLTNTGYGNLAGTIENFNENYSFINNKSSESFNLASGATINYIVTFDPEEEGTYPDSLIILSNSIENDSINISLSGRGIDDPLLYLSSHILEFDSVMTDSTRQLKFYIQNAAGSVLNGSLQNFSNNFAFERLSKGQIAKENEFSFALSAGQIDSFMVSFIPDDERDFIDSIVVTTDYNSDTLSLKGHGLLPPPILTSYPELLDFSKVYLHTDKTLELYLSNTGGDTLSGYLKNFSEDFGFQFKDRSDSIDFTLLQGEIDTIAVTFSPSEELLYNDSILINSDGGVDTVSLVGFGTVDPVLFASVNSLDFGRVYLAEDSLLSFFITNIGGDTLNGELTLDNAAYSVNELPAKNPLKLSSRLSKNSKKDLLSHKLRDSKETIAYSLAYQDTAFFEVIFTPQEQGIVLDSIILTSQLSTKAVHLLGEGRREAELVISTDSLQFDSVFVDAAKTLELYISNSGQDSLKGYLRNYSDIFSLAHQAKSDSLTFALGEGEVDTIEVIFSPLAEIAYLDSIHIHSNAADDTVALSGFGKKAPLLFASADSLDFGRVYLAEDSLLSFFITNIGGDILNGELSLDNAAYSVSELPAKKPLKLSSRLSKNSKRDLFSHKIITAKEEGKETIAYSLAYQDTAFFEVIFTPQEQGIVLDSIMLTSQLSTKAVHLLGIGRNHAGLSVSADTLQFDSVLVDDFRTMDLYLENSGEDSLKGYLRNYSDIFTLAHQAKSDSLTFALDEGEVDTIKVTFSPLAEIAYLDSIYIHSNAADDTVALSGFGKKLPVLFAGADSLHFGAIHAGEDSLQTLYITNIGGDTLRGDLKNFSNLFEILENRPITTSLSNSFTEAKHSRKQISNLKVKSLSKNDKLFRTKNDTLGFKLAYRDTMFFDVSFKPLYEGLVQDSIIVTSNGGADTLQLTGTGFLYPPLMEVSRDSINFGSVMANSSVSKEITISNKGELALTGYIYFKDGSFSVTNKEKRDLRSEINKAEILRIPFDIAGGDSTEFIVSFSAEEEGSYKDTLLVSSDDELNSDKEVLLRGVCEGDGEIELPDGELKFGLVELGLTRNDSILVRNNSSEEFIIREISGFQSAIFSSLDSEGLVVPALDSSYVRFSFTPAASETYHSTAKLYYDEELTKYLKVELSGTGIGDNYQTGEHLVVDPLEYDFGLMDEGEVRNTEITFRNPDSEDALTVVGFDLSYYQYRKFITFREKSAKGKKGNDKDGNYYYYLSAGDSITFDVIITLNDEALEYVNYGQLNLNVGVSSDATADSYQQISLTAKTEENPQQLEEFSLLTPKDEAVMYRSSVNFAWETANQSIDDLHYKLLIYNGQDSITVDSLLSGNWQSDERIKANVNYSWKVFVVNEYLGEKASRETWSFEIKQEGDISPNPFTPDSPDPAFAMAKFDIYDKKPDIKVKIFTIGGKFIKLLHLENQGEHWTAYWNGKNRHGEIVGPGVYIYQVFSRNKILRNGYIGVAR